MDTMNTLDNLLQIEAKAASLVKEAQEEADRRIHESEEKNRAAYEERFRVEMQKQDESFNKEKEDNKNKYDKMLDEYRNEISGININTERFSALLNEYLAVGR